MKIRNRRTALALLIGARGACCWRDASRRSSRNPRRKRERPMRPAAAARESESGGSGAWASRRKFSPMAIWRGTDWSNCSWSIGSGRLRASGAGPGNPAGDLHHAGGDFGEKQRQMDRSAALRRASEESERVSRRLARGSESLAGYLEFKPDTTARFGNEIHAGEYEAGEQDHPARVSGKRDRWLCDGTQKRNAISRSTRLMKGI